MRCVEKLWEGMRFPTVSPASVEDGAPVHAVSTDGSFGREASGSVVLGWWTLDRPRFHSDYYYCVISYMKIIRKHRPWKCGTTGQARLEAR